MQHLLAPRLGYPTTSLAFPGSNTSGDMCLLILSFWVTSTNFLCPRCAFQNAPIVETRCHVMQNQEAMRKYSCKMCQLSLDDKDMFDHCVLQHHQSERVVEVLDFKQIGDSELQTLSLIKPQTCDVSKDTGARPSGKSVVKRILRCLFSKATV